MSSDGVSADETLILLEKCTEFEPLLPKRGNLLSPETTCKGLFFWNA